MKRLKKMNETLYKKAVPLCKFTFYLDFPFPFHCLPAVDLVVLCGGVGDRAGNCSEGEREGVGERGGGGWRKRRGAELSPCSKWGRCSSKAGLSSPKKSPPEVLAEAAEKLNMKIRCQSRSCLTILNITYATFALIGEPVHHSKSSLSSPSCDI